MDPVLLGKKKYKEPCNKSTSPTSLEKIRVAKTINLLSAVHVEAMRSECQKSR